MRPSSASHWPFAFALLCVVSFSSSSGAERARSPGHMQVSHYDTWRCGQSHAYNSPPRAYARGDVDGDGVEDHFYANWGGVERFRVQEGTVPETLIRHSSIYRSSASHAHACVDLRFGDLDDDGDLDMVFASPQEVVILHQQRGRFRVASREALQLESTHQPRIAISGPDVTVN